MQKPTAHTHEALANHSKEIKKKAATISDSNLNRLSSRENQANSLVTLGFAGSLPPTRPRGCGYIYLPTPLRSLVVHRSSSRLPIQLLDRLLPLDLHLLSSRRPSPTCLADGAGPIFRRVRRPSLPVPDVPGLLAPDGGAQQPARRVAGVHAGEPSLEAGDAGARAVDDSAARSTDTTAAAPAPRSVPGLLAAELPVAPGVVTGVHAAGPLRLEGEVTGLRAFDDDTDLPRGVA